MHVIFVAVLVKGVRPGNGSPGEGIPDTWEGGGAWGRGGVALGGGGEGGRSPWSGEVGGNHTPSACHRD